MTIKRIFDFSLAAIGLLFSWWLILILIIIAYFDSGGKGVFVQKRVGQHGKLFKIYKIRSMHVETHQVSRYGKFIRKYKLDELPQLINILKGDMSFVGPRPDVPGYYDQLKGDDRKVLALKPGLCSWAALKYYNEEEVLAAQENPLKYNDEVIFPDKVKMNLLYLEQHSIKEDFKILAATIKKFLP